MSILHHCSTKELYPRIVRFKNLRTAYNHVRDKGGPTVGVDGESPKSWKTEGVNNKLNLILGVLRDWGAFETGPIKTVYIPKSKGKKRKIAVLCLRDRVVGRACYQVLSEIFDSRFNHSNFAYRPRRNRAQAALYCQQLIRSGKRFWLKADIKDCFGKIRRRRLNILIRKLVNDAETARLLSTFVAMEQSQTGIVQGGSLSPFFSNIYLDVIDNKLSENGYMFAHYGDDFVIGCASELQAKNAKQLLGDELGNIGLELNDKTRTLDLQEIGSFSFCNFQISQKEIGISPQGVERMQKKTKRLIDEYFNSGASGEMSDYREVAKNYESEFKEFTSTFRKIEKRRNKLLDRYSKVLGIFDCRLQPKYQIYVASWREQHEIVPSHRIHDAIAPVFKYAKERQGRPPKQEN